MENMIRILRAIEFIEQNLKENICLVNIASEACLSNFYFHKVFHLVVGDSPGEYIRKRRLHEAALLLKESRIKVIDVALDLGYKSPEAFSRAFKRHFGISPSEIKKNSNHLIRYPKPALTLTNLTHIHEGVVMNPRIIEKDEMKLVGPVYYGDNRNGEIPIFWKKYFPSIVSLPNRKGLGCFGFCFHTEDYVEKGFFYYMPAVEVVNLENIPDIAVGKIVPKHKYAVFTHSRDADELGETYKYIHGTWFPNKKYKVNEAFDFEHYTEDETGKDIIEIYIPIIDL